MPRGPEWYIARDWRTFLRARGWHSETMVGNRYQVGIPDDYLMHKEYGKRWVDYKNPASYTLTVAQRQKWPVWEQMGTGIWILTTVCEDEYAKLFAPPNWREYWKPRYGELGEVDALLDQIRLEN